MLDDDVADELLLDEEDDALYRYFALCVSKFFSMIKERITTTSSFIETVFVCNFARKRADGDVAPLFPTYRRTQSVEIFPRAQFTIDFCLIPMSPRKL